MISEMWRANNTFTIGDATHQTSPFLGQGLNLGIRNTFNLIKKIDLVNKGKISKVRLDEIIDRTRKGGAEVVKLLETGSAFYGPAASGIEMADSYLNDKKKTLPCAAYLNGEYGVSDLYVGVPVVIGSAGIEKVVELDLDEEEKKYFKTSIEAVSELFEAAKNIDPSLK